MRLEARIFEKHNLDVELVNFGGSTDQLLEAIGSGKADVGIGMILRWLKPLEQRFDVSLIAGVHGGCSYIIGSREAGITDIVSLRGKTTGLRRQLAPDGPFDTIEQHKCFTDGTGRRQPAVIAQNKNAAVSQIAHKTAALVIVRRRSLIIVATNTIEQQQGILRNRQRAILLRRYAGSGGRANMHQRSDVRPCCQDRAMDDLSGLADAVEGFTQDVAPGVDLHQSGGSDLHEEEAPGIDQVLVHRPRHA